MSVPEIRAAMVQDFLALMERDPKLRVAELRAAMPAGFVEDARRHARVAWIPLAPVANLAETARAILGEEGWRAAHRRAAAELLARPLFRALISGAYNLFGASPMTVLKVFPKVFELSHRNAGEISCEPVGSNRARLELRGAPDLALRRGFLDVFAGTIEGGAAPLCHRCELALELEPSQRRACFDLRWT
jgi:hypothetical protein